MSWPEFEMLLGEGFRLQGYQVLEARGGTSSDMALLVSRNHRKYLVQCKHWKAFKVSTDQLKELQRAMATGGAAGRFVVTSGVFTRSAAAFAQGCGIRLVDGTKLFGMLQQSKASLQGQKEARAAARPAAQVATRSGPAAAPARPQAG